MQLRRDIGHRALRDPSGALRDPSGALRDPAGALKKA
jgi:hypothetical protein